MGAGQGDHLSQTRIRSDHVRRVPRTDGRQAHSQALVAVKVTETRWRGRHRPQEPDVRLVKVGQDADVQPIGVHRGLTGLGATVVAEHETLTTPADPDGNEFCLLHP
jgi:hypothetical protein